MRPKEISITVNYRRRISDYHELDKTFNLLYLIYCGFYMVDTWSSTENSNRANIFKKGMRSEVYKSVVGNYNNINSYRKI